VTIIDGLNDQNLSLSGAEAALDVQFAFGISYPTPATYYTTAGRPPFKPSVGTPTNTNEPYADVSADVFISDYLFLKPLV